MCFRRAADQSDPSEHLGGPASPADVILAFDLERHVPKDNATTTGINVLLADGTVEFVDEATGKAIWAQFVSGVRPVRMPTVATPAATSAPSSPLPTK
jgi:hypothetical protein